MAGEHRSTLSIILGVILRGMFTGLGLMSIVVGAVLALLVQRGVIDAPEWLASLLGR